MDMELIKAALASMLRHAGTAVAGWLMTMGLIDEDMETTVVGVVVGLGALVWGVLQKYLAKRKAEQARPVN